MTDASRQIGVEETATVEVAFLSPVEARADFPPGTKTVFGYQPSIWGTFVLEKWLDDVD